MDLRSAASSSSTPSGNNFLELNSNRHSFPDALVITRDDSDHETDPPPFPSDLQALVKRLTGYGPFRCQPTARRIRLLFNGSIIADTRSALYVWEHEFHPQFYLPIGAFIKPAGVDMFLTYGEPIVDDHGRTIGGGLRMAVRRENTSEKFQVLSDMVLFAGDLEGPARPLSNHVKVVFDAVDQWFEEDTPIYVHPKDPCKNVGCLLSITPIRVTMPVGCHDLLLAESPMSIILYETNSPPQYYLPLTCIKAQYLQPSKTVIDDPYKGVAQYHHVSIGNQTFQDLIWWYRAPVAEYVALAGMRCFFNERVDIWLNDNNGWWKQERSKRSSVWRHD